MKKSNKQPNLHFNRNNLFLFIVFLIINSVLLSLYTENLKLILILSIPASFFPAHGFKKLWEAKRANTNRLLFTHFMQLISAEIATGITFTNAFINAGNSLTAITGRRNIIIRQLQHACTLLNAHVPIHQVIAELSRTIECKDAKPLLHIISLQLKTNGNMLNITKFATKIIHDLNETENQIKADNNKQTMEAYMMVIMPFIMTFILKFSAESYYAQAADNKLSIFLKIIAFFIAVTAGGLTFKITARNLTFKQYSPGTGLSKYINFFSKYQFFLKIGLLIKNLLSQELILQLQRSLTQTGMDKILTKKDGKTEADVDKFCALILPTFIFGTIISYIILIKLNFLIIIAMPSGMLFVFLLLYLPKQLAKKCRDNLIINFPLLIGMINALLNSNFVPQRAIDLSIELYSKENNVLANALKEIKHGINSGYNFQKGLINLAKNCQVAEIQSALNLINQYSVQGNQEALILLNIQSGVCWQLAKNTLREEQESNSFKILIPMMLNLISIMIFAATPVLVSFNIN